MLSLVSLVSLIASSAAIGLRAACGGVVVFALAFVTALSGQIILLAYALGAFDRLNDVSLWALGSVGGALVLGGLAWGGRPFVPLRFDAGGWRRDLAALSGFRRALLVVLAAAFAYALVVNLLMLWFVAPYNWDSHTYHLARAAYYVQQGSFEVFPSNFIAQIVHLKNNIALFVYLHLMTGSEPLLQLPQFAAYLTTLVALYGIARQIGCGRVVSLGSALTGGLLTTMLMQATTTQNDLLLAACIAIAAYGLIAYGEGGGARLLLLVGAAMGIAAGIKQSGPLAFPSLALLALYALWRQRMRLRPLALLAAGGLLLAFALPSGYLDNLREYGDMTGPEGWRRAVHAFDDGDLGGVMVAGTKNLLRYGFEFLSVDGLEVPLLTDVTAFARRALGHALLGLSIDLEDPYRTRLPFDYEQPPLATEDFSYWGILGLGLVWPGVFWALSGVRRSLWAALLAAGALLFVVIQAYSSLYDPWRGRFFLMAIVFAVPALAWAWEDVSRSRVSLALLLTRAARPPLRLDLLRPYVLAVALLGALGVVQAMHTKTLGFELFRQGRLQQMTLRNPGLYDVLTQYEAEVPPDATVVAYLLENSYEYPLFGQGWTRTVLPITATYQATRTLPAEADYLLYQRAGEVVFPDPLPDDRLLGRDLRGEWYLRRLR